ncbi:hypothetical protein MA16_Dca017529 [Dendrobium catenatum]|uniref:Uncharacterized protein n=1 Tax=Dendrobium catenatum TaxID=906689 RepID=A0A2I0X3V8_9ASPA|nr:hypothetical protein MA16_Dca017529 [Dendrobium catenatum]
MVPTGIHKKTMALTVENLFYSWLLALKGLLLYKSTMSVNFSFFVGTVGSIDNL